MTLFLYTPNTKLLQYSQVSRRKISCWDKFQLLVRRLTELNNLQTHRKKKKRHKQNIKNRHKKYQLKKNIKDIKIDSDKLFVMIIIIKRNKLISPPLLLDENS